MILNEMRILLDRWYSGLISEQEAVIEIDCLTRTPSARTPANTLAPVDTVSDITFGHVCMVNSVMEAIVKAGEYNTVKKRACVAMDIETSTDDLKNMTLTISPTLEG